MIIELNLNDGLRRLEAQRRHTAHLRPFRLHTIGDLQHNLFAVLRTISGNADLGVRNAYSMPTTNWWGGTACMMRRSFCTWLMLVLDPSWTSLRARSSTCGHCGTKTGTEPMRVCPLGTPKIKLHEHRRRRSSCSSRLESFCPRN